MKNKLFSLIAIIMLAFVGISFTSCGSGSDGDSDSDNGNSGNTSIFNGTWANDGLTGIWTDDNITFVFKNGSFTCTFYTKGYRYRKGTGNYKINIETSQVTFLYKEFYYSEDGKTWVSEEQFEDFEETFHYIITENILKLTENTSTAIFVKQNS